MAELAFAIPGDLAARTGGYEYDRRLLAFLPAEGWTPTLLAWPGGFPFPDGAALSAAEDSLARLAAGTPVLIDGLAFGALPDLAAKEGARLRLVALVHHPLALESGLSDTTRRDLALSERQALTHARGVITTSATTAETLAADYGVPRARLRIAHPGSDPVPLKPRTRQDGMLSLLSVGAVIPRKGYDLLIAALARPQAQDWHARIIGSLERDPACVAALRRQITDLGLSDRVDLLGELPSLAEYYAAADLFVLPSRHEGYGMVFAEALRHGLPIVATRAGAIPEAVPAEAGLLVPPEDVPALAQALAAMRDNTVRARFAAGAAHAARGLPRWQDTARRVAEALRALAG